MISLGMHSAYSFRVALMDYTSPGRPPVDLGHVDVELRGFEAEYYSWCYSQDYVEGASLQMISYCGWDAGWEPQVRKALILARSVFPRPPPYYRYHTNSVCKSLGEAVTAAILSKLGVSCLIRLPGSGSVWRPANADFLADVRGSLLEERFEEISSVVMVECRGYMFPQEDWRKTAAKVRGQLSYAKVANSADYQAIASIVYLGETAERPRRVFLVRVHK